MEFWGEEVKSGQTVSVQPGTDNLIHVSQAALGEVKKDKAEHIYLYVTIDGKKLVIGTLNSDKLPQQQFDLLFDKDFEISHSWKGGSVYFFGYKSANAIDIDEESESEEELPSVPANSGKPVTKVDAADKASAKASASHKKKVKIAEPSDEDTSEDEEGSEDENDSDEDESDEESEETPKKAESSKKRPADTATKTPVPDKKAKFVTPQKTDGKKGAVHVDTPHPSKQAGKTPGNKPNQTPKSGGSHACKPCNRTFGTESALDSHNKAKHSAGK